MAAPAALGGHTLPDLPYPYDGLEPFISKQIMELHHKKHHQTHVNALNAAQQAYAKATTPEERIALQSALKFNWRRCVLLLLVTSTRVGYLERHRRVSSSAS